ncbi:hypothetical protein [Rhizobium hidalgonense]|uniref:Uncharacterized protein n=1 Tax=Rhizobium hidalgonense TaxID=1538159 RepID=A0ABX4JWI4_9HYPH|nr:hypothetical protein [Rhizobium hidalgonense]PDT24465.1 hypothetical protein CO674_07210 [Rhizobium hidalgonense]PON04856.1 hypothetical protein ATY29_25700 [Rhizobium hidalgonense]
MDIMMGLAAATQALDIAKKLREFDQDFKASEFRLQIAELYGNLADVKIALADAKAALQEKDQEIERLKRVNEGKLKTIRIGNYNFGIGEDGKPLSKAFCPACEQSNGAQIPISRGLSGHDLCPKCQGVYDARATNLPVGFKMPE